MVDDDDRIEHVHLRSADARRAIKAFGDGKTALVLGGTFSDLPFVNRDGRAMRNALHFDPVAGSVRFGPGPGRRPRSPTRRCATCSTAAIDRDAMVAALDVPNLVPRATLLQGGLEGGANPIVPDWTAVAMPERRAAAAAEAHTLLGENNSLKLAIALPEGPGADILLARLAADWQPLGIELRAGRQGHFGRPQADRPSGAVDLSGMVRAQLPLWPGAALFEAKPIL